MFKEYLLSAKKENDVVSVYHLPDRPDICYCGFVVDVTDNDVLIAAISPVGLRTLYTMRFIPLILSVLSTLLIYGKYSGKFLPYQNLTTEILIKQKQQMDKWETLLMIGLISIVLSVIFLIIIKKNK